MVRVRAIVRRRKYFSIAPDGVARPGAVHPYVQNESRFREIRPRCVRVGKKGAMSGSDRQEEASDVWKPVRTTCSSE